MTLLHLGFLLLSVLAIVCIQLWYRSANYPKTRRWKMILFFSSFTIGAGIATLLGLESQQVAWWRRLIFVLLGGLFFGLIYTFLFPEQLKSIYPYRGKSNDSEQER